MTLTTNQEKFAYKEAVIEFVKLFGSMGFTKPELKLVLNDSHTWAELNATKQDFNDNLTAGNFKTNATADQKRLMLIFALLAIIKG